MFRQVANRWVAMQKRIQYPNDVALPKRYRSMSLPTSPAPPVNISIRCPTGRCAVAPPEPVPHLDVIPCSSFYAAAHSVLWHCTRIGNDQDDEQKTDDDQAPSAIVPANSYAQRKVVHTNSFPPGSAVADMALRSSQLANTRFGRQSTFRDRRLQSNSRKRK